MAALQTTPREHLKLLPLTYEAENSLDGMVARKKLEYGAACRKWLAACERGLVEGKMQPLSKLLWLITSSKPAGVAGYESEGSN